jgi:hypothetical protein
MLNLAVRIRNQLTALDDEISGVNSNAESRAFNPNGVDDLSGLTISNPPDMRAQRRFSFASAPESSYLG